MTTRSNPKPDDLHRDKPTKETAAGFSEDEKMAMQERAKELKSSRTAKSKADGEADLLAKIAEMQGSDRKIAEKIHSIIKAHFPQLSAKTWYGMPAYTLEGQVLCFFQSSGKFKTRYSTLGFNEMAKLDEGSMWPTSFAVKSLGIPEEEKIHELLRKAVGE